MNKTMNEIVERAKDVLSYEHPGEKVYDKNVAHAIGINPDTLKIKKHRGQVPHAEFTMFCLKREVSLNWLFVGIGPMRICDAKKNM